MNKLTDREIATILAALRDFQKVQYIDRGDYPQLEEFAPLDDSEIDELCDKLNTSIDATCNGRSRSLLEVVTGY